MAAHHAAPSPLAAGLRCRCPRCGRGRLFSGYLNVAEHCGACGLKLADHDSGDGPAVFLMFVLGAVFVGLALWTEATFAPPIWLHMALWPVLILAVTLTAIRPLKAFVVALQYRHRRHTFDDS